MFKKTEFQEDEENAKQMLLDSHSIQKYASTYCRVCGIHKDDNNVELPYPDAKVAAVLCGGSPCFYVTNQPVDAAMMTSFILSHVLPNVRKMLPESACLVLGKALMRLISSSVAGVYVPVEVKGQVLSDWAHVLCGGDLDVDGTDVHTNPIQKLAVVVSGNHGAVFIDTVEEMEGEGGGCEGDSRVGM
jgi:hypothetical protein